MKTGFTLLELMVAVFVLGLFGALSGIAIRSLDSGPTAAALNQIRATREEAIRTGRPALWEGEELVVRFLPDGSSSGGRLKVDGTTFTIDPLTGYLNEAH